MYRRTPNLTRRDGRLWRDRCGLLHADLPRTGARRLLLSPYPPSAVAAVGLPQVGKTNAPPSAPTGRRYPRVVHFTSLGHARSAGTGYSASTGGLLLCGPRARACSLHLATTSSHRGGWRAAASYRSPPFRSPIHSHPPLAAAAKGLVPRHWPSRGALCLLLPHPPQPPPPASFPLAWGVDVLRTPPHPFCTARCGSPTRTQHPPSHVPCQ